MLGWEATSSLSEAGSNKIMGGQSPEWSPEGALAPEDVILGRCVSRRAKFCSIMSEETASV